MNKKMKMMLAALILMTIVMSSYAQGNNTDGVSAASEQTAQTEQSEVKDIGDVAAKLGVTEDELKKALGDPQQGAPDFPDAAEKLGVSAEELEELMKMIMGSDGGSVEVDPHTITLNGLDIEIIFEVYSWNELPSDVEYERQTIQTYTDPYGNTHYYEAVYVKSGNLNWYQAAYLAEDAGGYLACPTTDEENSFIFSLVNDTKYFWSFPEEGSHYGISIGPSWADISPTARPNPTAAGYG